MAIIKLLHGSDHVIEKPNLNIAKPTNDYGRGFYCTDIPEMAKEWACKKNVDGIVNEYYFDFDGLNILNLLDGNYNVLNWIAILLNNRIFTINSPIALKSKNYIIDNFSIDISKYDVVIGYRADDSYFSYAQSFIHNELPLKSLGKALMLGNLGKQIVLVSEKAIKNLHFCNSSYVDKNIYYPKFLNRDTNARLIYNKKIKNSDDFLNDLFVMDIMREEIKNDDERIQRIIFK